MGRPKNEVVSVDRIAKHNEAMIGLWKGALSAENRENLKNSHASAEDLVAAADDYIQYIARADVGLTPSVEGFAIYIGISNRQIMRWKNNPSDERRVVLERLEDFCREYHNQAGLTGATNTIFEIYYLKSKFGQSDQPTSHTLNVRVSGTVIQTASDVADFIDDVPLEGMIEADFEDHSSPADIADDAILAEDESQLQ